jgi:hypothetical protein
MVGSEFSEEIPEGSRKMAYQENSTLSLEAVEAEENAEKEMMDNAHKKRKGGTQDEIQATVPAHKNEGKSLVLLQVNCRSIYNKALEFWNLADTYNPDIIRGTELRLREEIGNTEIFRADFTTFRRDRHAQRERVCVKNNIVYSELWVDDEFETTAVEVKGSDPKRTWEIIGIYTAPKEDVRVIERLAARTGFLGNSMKRSIIGGDLNLPQVEWKGIAEGTSVTQAFINRLVWENGYTQVVGKPTQGDSLLDFTSCDPKMPSYLAVQYKGSVTIAGC